MVCPSLTMLLFANSTPIFYCLRVHLVWYARISSATKHDLDVSISGPWMSLFLLLELGCALHPMLDACGSCFPSTSTTLQSWTSPATLSLSRSSFLRCEIFRLARDFLFKTSVFARQHASISVFALLWFDYLLWTNLSAFLWRNAVARVHHISSRLRKHLRFCYKYLLGRDRPHLESSTFIAYFSDCTSVGTSRYFSYVFSWFE